VAEELNVAVIGGGYAGMAAAVELASHGIPVTVFESAKQLGGRARGVPHEGLMLDNGQHILLGCYRDTLRMVETVGGDIDRDFLRLPLQLTLHHRFELKAPTLPAPFHLLIALMTAHGLTFSQRIKAARFMLAMRLKNFRLEHDLPAYELLRDTYQDEVLIRLLWEPICISALNTPVHKASAQVLLNVLRDSLNGSFTDSEMLMPRVDFSALFPERAAAYVRSHGGSVELSSGVDAITPVSEGIELHTAQGARRFSHVVCAASPANTVRLFRALPPLQETAARIEALRFQPIYTVYLQYPDHVRLPQAMLGLDGCLSQWLFDKGQIAGQNGLIAVVISAEGVHQELDHGEVAQSVARELQEQLGLPEAPLWHRVIAEKRATFACEPALDRPESLTQISGLLLAGDYTAGDYPATLEGAIQSGLRCAREIIKVHPPA